MKILQLISSSGMYGAEYVILNLARVLTEHSITPIIACLKRKHDPEPELSKHARERRFQCITPECSLPLDLYTIRSISKILAREQAQLIHSHGYKADIYGYIASRMSGIPIIATLHGWTGDTKKLRLYEALDRWIIRKMDAIIAVSPLIYQVIKKWNSKRNNCFCIPNSIDTDRFSPDNHSVDLRQNMGIEDSFVIGTVGRLSVEKGHMYLLRAFKQVHSFLPKAKLVIVGEGNMAQALKLETLNLGIEKKVIFTGAKEDMASVYKTFDVFVLPSLTEGLPLVLLEAMSMKLPVVASNVGGIPSIIDTDNGILIEPKNINQIVEAVRSLSQKSSLRVEMGTRARKKIVSEFALGAFFNRYNEVYATLLQAKGN